MQLNVRRDQPDNVRFSIVNKLLIQILAVILCLALVFWEFGYRVFYQGLIQRNLNDLSVILNDATLGIESELNRIVADIAFISNLPELNRYIDSFSQPISKNSLHPSTGEIAKHLNELFHGLLVNRPRYFQLRVIKYANNGKELIRVERVPGELPVQIVSADSMQSKGNRDYVIESKSKPPNQVFLSDIQLNREHGTISYPETITIRAVTKLADRRGKAFGLLVLNYDLNPLFAELVVKPGGLAKIYLWNQQGQFLLHPDPNLAMGFERGNSKRIQDVFPQLADHLNPLHSDASRSNLDNANQEELGIIRAKDLLFAKNLISLDIQSAKPERYIQLGLISEYKYVQQLALSGMQQSATALLMIIPIMVLLSVYFSRRITRSIISLSKAAYYYGQSDKQLADSQLEIAMKNTDESGQLAHYFTDMMQNIEDQNRIIRENEVALDAALNSMGDGYLTMDERNVIRYVNGKLCEIFGYLAKELIGQNISLLLTPQQAEALLEYQSYYLEDIKDEELSEQKEWNAITCSGMEIIIELTLTVFSVKEKTMFGAVIRDITQRKANESLLKQYAAELLRSNEDLKNFAHLASHDLKAPLRNIAQLASWMEEDIDNKEELLENLSLMIQRVNKMQTLLDDLLQYSRVGKSEKDKQEFESLKVITDLFDLLNVSNQFYLVTKGDFPRLKYHRTLFEILFRNLFDNAIKHHDKKSGTITVNAAQFEDFTQFSVHDDGPGIESQYIDEIFQFLRRVNTKVDGSGMGLSLVKKIMDTVGGTINVRSELGHGCTFVIHWPSSW